MADNYLLDMTGADFREYTEWDGVDEILKEEV